MDVTTNDPAIYGFLSGTYKDGSPIYPGVGVYPNCGNYPRYSRVKRDPNSALCVCGNSEIQTNQGIKFFAAHPNLKWVYTNKSTIASVSGLIPPNPNEADKSYITRLKLTGFQQIGTYDPAYGVLWYWNGETRLDGANGDFEVLVCQDSAITTTGKI